MTMIVPDGSEWSGIQDATQSHAPSSRLVPFCPERAWSASAETRDAIAIVEFELTLNR